MKEIKIKYNNLLSRDYYKILEDNSSRTIRIGEARSPRQESLIKQKEKRYEKIKEGFLNFTKNIGYTFLFISSGILFWYIINLFTL